MWVKCSKCQFGGNGNNTCKYGKDVKKCAEDVGCVTTGVPIKKLVESEVNLRRTMKMKEFEILVSYLRETNFNEDGSASDDDDYYKVIRMKATSKKDALENIEEFIFNSEGGCGIEEDYVEGTLEVKLMLSEIGHIVI